MGRAEHHRPHGHHLSLNCSGACLVPSFCSLPLGNLEHRALQAKAGGLRLPSTLNSPNTSLCFHSQHLSQPLPGSSVSTLDVWSEWLRAANQIACSAPKMAMKKTQNTGPFPPAGPLPCPVPLDIWSLPWSPLSSTFLHLGMGHSRDHGDCAWGIQPWLHVPGTRPPQSPAQP